MNRIKDFTKHLEAFEGRYMHMDIGPAALYIESVKGCPYSCAMCHFKKSKPKRMPEALLEKIESSFKDLEVMAIHGQGEPLLGDLAYFVDHSVRHDCVLHLNTTGFLLTKRVSDLLSRTRLSIRFSIHAGRRATYRRIMGYDLDKIKRHVTYLMERLARSNKRCDLWFSFIVMKENVNEVDDFLHFAHDCGIRSVRFMRLLSNWQSLRGLRLKDRNFKFNYFEQFNRKVKDQFLNRLSEYEELSRRLGIKIEYGSMQSRSERPHPLKESMNTLITAAFGNGLFPLFKVRGACLAPWIGQPVVNQDGDVRLCCATTFTIGNVKESTLHEIWNSNRMKAVRKSFREGHNPKACGYCKGFYFGNYPNNAFEGIKR